MADVAAQHGQPELELWLCRERGFARPGISTMDEDMVASAAFSGDLELVQWLRTNGCPWDFWTCSEAVHGGQVEVLRWARENGCKWDAYSRDKAAAKLGYTDDFGNLA